MTRKIVIAQGASASLAAVFGGASFPLDVTLTNLMPRSIVLPDVGCPTLGGTGSDTQSTALTIKDMASLKLLVANVEQIAALNGYGDSMVIEEATAPTEGTDGAPAKSTKKTKSAE